MPDADLYQPNLLAALRQLPRPAYELLLPPQRQLGHLRTVQSLAAVLCAAIKSRLKHGPYIIAGVGSGGVVAHEMATQLHEAGDEVSCAHKCWLTCVRILLCLDVFQLGSDLPCISC